LVQTENKGFDGGEWICNKESIFYIRLLKLQA
jgi:hypothetical protein